MMQNAEPQDACAPFIAIENSRTATTGILTFMLPPDIGQAAPGGRGDQQLLRRIAAEPGDGPKGGTRAERREPCTTRQSHSFHTKSFQFRFGAACIRSILA